MSESFFLPFNKLTDWYVDGLEAFGASMRSRGRCTRTPDGLA